MSCIEHPTVWSQVIVGQCSTHKIFIPFREELLQISIPSTQMNVRAGPMERGLAIINGQVTSMMEYGSLHPFFTLFWSTRTGLVPAKGKRQHTYTPIHPYFIQNGNETWEIEGFLTVRLFKRMLIQSHPVVRSVAELATSQSLEALYQWLWHSKKSTKQCHNAKHRSCELLIDTCCLGLLISMRVSSKWTLRKFLYYIVDICRYIVVYYCITFRYVWSACFTSKVVAADRLYGTNGSRETIQLSRSQDHSAFLRRSGWHRSPQTGRWIRRVAS